MILAAIHRRKADSKAKALATPRPADILAPKNPIILVHGLFGFDTLFGIINYWNDIPDALVAVGAEVFVARVPATSSVGTRAAALVTQIAKKYRGRSVHLIGYSMGGLDCRHLVTHMLDGAGFKVLSVTTIATPHRGSPAADVFVDTHITDVPGFRGLMNILPSGDGDGEAFASLSTSNCRAFNTFTPDVSGVRYFSWGASFIPGLIDTVIWGAPFRIINGKEGANDGMVSVSSARWGQYLGTIQGVNHTEIIGLKFNPRRTDVSNFIEGQAPFDHTSFFVKHASMLAKEVEG
ncbi:hypothetical protein FRB94_006699 [Tulasnella sp. JGI-2019a]|nr:hypothetical protein FRB94_006699 [Tulasnella sp. JGI-2019a]